MLEENFVGEAAAAHPADLPAGEMVAGRWALGIGGALIILLAVTEAAHWQAALRMPAFEEVVQQSAPVSSPSLHPDVPAPDPGDNP